MIAISSVKRNV